jgi:hypothetical protein
MTPEEASKAGKRVTIETTNGGDRISAHYFDTPDGFVYADLGWNDLYSTTHALHHIKCDKFDGGYQDKKGNRLDIYIDDCPMPEVGVRKVCWEKAKAEFDL